MEKKGVFSIGKIVATHGIKGALKVYPYTESMSFYKPGNQIFVKNSEREEKAFIVQCARPHRRSILVFLEGVTTCDLARTLIGSELYADKANLPELEEGTYYWLDIIGLSVYTVDKRYIGRVQSVFRTGSNDVFVVRDPGKEKNNETLVPALESVVLEIDLKKKTMQVDLPEGL
jgi:16S rRNA processing protein RimM